MPLSLICHADGRARCSWCGEGDALADYIAYHDHEWGMPTADPVRLFEKLTLEGFQSGLSWLTVLRKRERFRQVFAGFDAAKLAKFGEADVTRLLQDTGIIRHRGKIESAINNAKRVCEMAERGESLAALIWQHEPKPAQRPKRITPEMASTLAQTEQSLAFSKTLKKRGFSFVGPTTMYALMQSMGVVNDHLEGCSARDRVEAARKQFVRPV